MNEFIQYFGEGPKLEIKVKIEGSGETNCKLSVTRENNYTLYWQMQLFFANGGGTCYVVSVGLYTSAENLTSKMVDDALVALTKEREVTLIVVPEAAFSNDDCAKIQQSMMKHCNDMGNRFAILDVPKDKKNASLDKRIETFQNSVTEYLSYGAAYFPWLNTTVLSKRDLTGDMFTWDDSVWKNMANLEKADASLVAILKSFSSKTDVLELKKKDEKKEDEEKEEGISFDTVTIGPLEDGKVTGIEMVKDESGNVTAKKVTVVRYSKDNLTDMKDLHLALYNGSPLYKQAIKGVLKQLNLLPPSAAMAGIYTMVDHNRGVWKAPANVSLNYVDSPAEDLDDDEQANLNAPMNGKAVNVIRTFRGEGVKVWGARTLDGNSLDWRYINVRRTLLFLEESVRNAARAYVFEPNDANTWVKMKGMIENFLNSVWKRGGLAGSTPEEAFEVHVGLGDTMTGDDILEYVAEPDLS